MTIEIKNKILDHQNIKTVSNEEVDLIDFNLSLSPENRLLNHQRALDTLNELIKARKQIYGELEFSIIPTTTK